MQKLAHTVVMPTEHIRTGPSKVLQDAKTGTHRAPSICRMGSGLRKFGSLNVPGFVNQGQCSTLVRKNDVDLSSFSFRMHGQPPCS